MADLRSDEFMNHALRDWEDMVYRLALSQTREPADASDVCQIEERRVGKECRL